MNAPEPYYCNDWLRVFVADQREVLPALALDPADIALIHADAPYGVAEATDRASRGRGLKPSTSAKMHTPGTQRARRFRPVVGDDRPLDASHTAPLLALGRPTVLWGANNFPHLLPPPDGGKRRRWIWWDKRAGSTPDDNADGEMAWTTLRGVDRQITHIWRGVCRASETGVSHLAPTQKPVAVVAKVFAMFGLKRGDRVVVPYLGSGPEIAACEAMGLRCDVIDVDPFYAELALRARLGITTRRLSDADEQDLADALVNLRAGDRPPPGQLGLQL